MLPGAAVVVVATCLLLLLFVSPGEWDINILFFPAVNLWRGKTLGEVSQKDEGGRVPLADQLHVSTNVHHYAHTSTSLRPEVTS